MNHRIQLPADDELGRIIEDAQIKYVVPPLHPRLLILRPEPEPSRLIAWILLLIVGLAFFALGRFM